MTILEFLAAVVRLSDGQRVVHEHKFDLAAFRVRLPPFFALRRGPINPRGKMFYVGQQIQIVNLPYPLGGGGNFTV